MCQLPKQQAAMLALPVLGRLLGNSANLFQVGVLLGTIPTLLAGVVCCYWAYQVRVRSRVFFVLVLVFVLSFAVLCCTVRCGVSFMPGPPAERIVSMPMSMPMPISTTTSRQPSHPTRKHDTDHPREVNGCGMPHAPPPP